MTDKNINIPKSETFTWLQPGTWRKPCIVHVTMVANSRQALFGKLTHNGSEAIVEKTPIGWALINQQRRLLEMCPEIKILADKVITKKRVASLSCSLLLINIGCSILAS